MKRVFIILTACLLLLPLSAFGQSLGQGSQRVFDNARLMGQSEINQLEGTINLLKSQYGMDYVIVTSNDVKTGGSRAFADDFYDDNGFGTGKDFSGALILIDTNNRELTISTSGLMDRYITDLRLNTLLDTAAPYLTSGEYAQASLIALAQISVYLKNGIPSDQYNQDEEGVIDRNVKPRILTMGEAAIALLAGIASGFGLFLAVRHAYAMKGSAYKYDLNKNTNVNITGATDIYLRTQVTRVPRASNSSGGGGMGGSRTSTHRSSSGRSHGGGSRKF